MSGPAPASDVARLAPELPDLLDEARVATFRAATPFPFLVIEPAIDAAAVQALRAAVSNEPHWPHRHEIYEMLGSTQPPQHPVLQRFVAELSTPEQLAVVGRLVGDSVTAVEAASYVYLPGHYLLPHEDYGAEGGRNPAARVRRLAWIVYLSDPDEFEGGELELFGEWGSGGQGPGESLLVRPSAGALVLFAVSARSLHQVREVEAGARCSLAGWFTE